MFKPPGSFLNDRSKAGLFWKKMLFVFCVCLSSVWSVPCSLVVTCWELTDLLAVFYVIFSCVFDTFPYGVLDQLVFDCIDS